MSTILIAARQTGK